MEQVLDLGLEGARAVERETSGVVPTAAQAGVLTRAQRLALVPRSTVPMEEIRAAMTPGGGWKWDQLRAWGVPTPPPRGWIERLAIDGARARPEQSRPRLPGPRSDAPRHPKGMIPPQVLTFLGLEVWEVPAQVRNVACPDCGAAPFAECVRADFRRNRNSGGGFRNHAARTQAWMLELARLAQLLPFD